MASKRTPTVVLFLDTIRIFSSTSLHLLPFTRIERFFPIVHVSGLTGHCFDYFDTFFSLV